MSAIESISREQETIRQQTAADVEAYLRNGGVIQQIPAGVSADTVTFRLFICHTCGGSNERYEGRNICKPCRAAEVRARKARRAEASA